MSTGMNRWLQIAAEVRREADALAAEHGWHHSLVGRCMTVNPELLRRLREAGADARLVRGAVVHGEWSEDWGHHFWVEVDSHYLCVTSTQFGDGWAAVECRPLESLLDTSVYPHLIRWTDRDPEEVISMYDPDELPSTYWR